MMKAATRTLYVHAGHGKTGSSYLQSVLQRNVDTLRAAGIHYPSGARAEEVASGGISSGNGALLTERRGKLAPVPAGCRGVLFSREQFFSELREDATKAAVARAAAHYGCTEVAVLLFIRDPVEMLSSIHQQAIKRGGSTVSLSRHATRFDQPASVFEFLNDVSARPNHAVTVRNYSRCRDGLAGELLGWLGVPGLALAQPPRERVNRSLTAGELAFQRRLNEQLGRSGKLVADPLCEQLPDVVPTRMIPDEDEQRAMLRRLAPAMEAVNALIEPEHRYRADLVLDHSVSERDAMLTIEQIEVIAESLGREIFRLREAIGEPGRRNKRNGGEGRPVRQAPSRKKKKTRSKPVPASAAPAPAAPEPASLLSRVRGLFGKAPGGSRSGH